MFGQRTVKQCRSLEVVDALDADEQLQCPLLAHTKTSPLGRREVNVK